MQREYQVDLCDLWRGALSLRKLRVLIEYLPNDCASARAIARVDGPLAQWSISDALLARAVDELAAFRWQWESAHIDPKRQRQRKAPESVVPREKRARIDTSDDNVIPLVSPHKLGGFIEHDDLKGEQHDD